MTPQLPPPAESAAELASEYEDLLHTVWRCERDWAFDDRIALAVRGLRGQREKAR